MAATTEAAQAARGGVDSARAWLVVAAAFLSTFSAFAVTYSFGAFFKPMADEFHTGKGATSFVFAITTFLYFVLGLPAGRIADRRGPKAVVLTGAAALAVGLWLTSFVSQLWVGYLTYGLGVGVAVACAYVPMVSQVGGWFERKRASALGLAVAGIGVGTLVGPPAASALIEAYGWRTTYRIFGVVAPLLLALCAALAARPPAALGAPPPPPLGELVRRPSFRLLYAAMLLVSPALYVPFVFLTAYAKDNGVSSGRAALLLSLIGAASTAGRLGLGTVSDRFGAFRLYGGCVLVMCASGLIWLAAGRSYALLLVYALVMGVSYGGFIALSPAVAALVFGPAGLGGVLGALYTAAGLGGLVGPPVIGAIIDGTESYTPAILAAIALGLGGFGLLTRLGAAAGPAPSPAR